MRSMALISGLLLVLIVAAVLAILAFEIWMFLDVLKNQKLTDTEKLLWVLGMILLHPFVAMVYYFVASSKRTK